MDNLYKELVQPSTLISESLDYFLGLNSWKKFNGFDVTLVDKNIWSCELPLNVIDQKYNIAHCSILKIDANVNYNWHTDLTRGLAINMLLSDSHSHCLFGYERDKFSNNFVELKYKPKKFYLFNTQHPHSILNFNFPRYLFTVEFVKDATQLTYQEVYNWCKENGMLVDE